MPLARLRGEKALPEDLIRVVRHGLREIRYRPHLIDGILAETGLSISALP